MKWSDIQPSGDQPEQPRQMPGPGFIPGQLNLNPAIAPQVPQGAARPFAPGEWIANPNGSWSSEESMTVPWGNGEWANIPSLWLKDGKAYVAHNEDEATELAKGSGLPFKTYPDESSADKASRQREDAWQGIKPQDAGKIAPLWGGSPQGQTLKWSDIGKAPSRPVVDTAEPPDRAVEGREAARGTDADALSAEASPFGGSSGTLQRVWDGMLGKDVSRTGRFGMGLADPVYGGAQIGARMMASPGGGVPEQAGAPAAPDRTAEVDKLTQQREESYQQREKAAGLSLPENAGIMQRLWHGLTTEGPRLAGNVTATAPLAAVPAAGATVPARIALGAGAGALGGASMPVTGQPGQTPNFLREKLKQAGYGALGGAAGQAVGEAIPPVARAIGQSLRPPAGALGVPGLRPPGPPRPPGPMSPATQQMVQQRFQRAAPMSRAGITDAGDIANMQQNRASAVQSIMREKQDLTFETPKGEVSGRTPETRGQLLQAYDQVMEKLFNKWNAMTEKTGAGMPPGGVSSTINKFRTAFNAASNKMAAAKDVLDRARSKLAAELVSPSGEASGSARTAANAVHKADTAFKAAENERIEAARQMQKPWVDAKPIVAELDRFAADEGIAAAPGSKSVLAYAKDQAAKYREMEAISPADVQKAITSANRRLAAYYNNPSFETADHAAVDAMIANQLRKGLDKTISEVTGPGYQALKREYGAMAASRKDVAAAAVRGLKDPAEASFIDGLINITSFEELAHGLISLRADPVMRGLLFRAGRSLQRQMTNPDRQVRLMFQQAERAQRIRDAGFAGNALAGALSISAGEEFQPAPKVGGRGPLGGRIIATTPTRRDVPAGP